MGPPTLVQRARDGTLPSALPRPVDNGVSDGASKAVFLKGTAETLKERSAGDPEYTEGSGPHGVPRMQGWWDVNSVQFSRSVVSDSLRPHGLQHARPPCPSPTPRVYSNSCLPSQ